VGRRSGAWISKTSAITGDRVDPGRGEQADLVVVTEHPDRDVSEPGELSDGEHILSLGPRTV
jgi:hypothetical protein